MSQAPDTTLPDPKQAIADLERRLAERTAERDHCKTERDAYKAERDEAVAQQTATAEVLQVINSSPGDLAPVFEAILDKAQAVCGFPRASLLIREAEQFRAVSVHGVPEEFTDFLRRGFYPSPNGAIGRLLEGEPFVHITDMAQLEDPMGAASVRPGGPSHLL